MGLIKCPECGKEISDMAGTCPNCGRPMQAASNGQQEGGYGQQPGYGQQQAGQSQRQKKKGHGCLITVLIFLAVMVLISVAIASTAQKKDKSQNADSSGDDVSQDGGTQQEESGSDGEEIAFGQEGAIDDGLTLIVNEVTETDQISAVNGMMSYKPKSGKYAVINVTIRNNSKKSKSLLLNYFNLVDPDDAKYVASIVAAADDKFITVDTINPNLDITGNLVFEIPNELSAQDCTLRYSDYQIFSQTSYFKLK